MVLLAKCLLLLFMIIVVHGNIVVNVEQKVNIDGCCNGCCPCNSCEPVKYKCKHGIDGICRKECLIWEIDMGDCEATNGEDCDYQCCVEDPCWNNGIPLPEYNLEKCTKTYCKVDGPIIEIIVEKLCGNDTGCCFLPNTEPKKMVCPGYKYGGGCLVETCENSTWVPSIEYILDHCLHCRVNNDPHFRAFSGARFDYQEPCNYALVQEGTADYPNFGIFMDFIDMGSYSAVGPMTYIEGGIKYIFNPGAPYSGHPKIPSDILVWSLGSCIRIYGTQYRVLVELCHWQITIWAPELGVHGYPKLGGLCSTNNYAWTLVARDGISYLPPPFPPNTECNAAFGNSWQTLWWGQTQLWCPLPFKGRKKRDAEDPQTVCSDVTDSPYNKECLDIVQNAGLTGTTAETFHTTCMFDLCIVVGMRDNETITKDQMVEQIRQITAEVKNQENKTVDYCMALGGVHVGGQSLYLEMDMKLSWNKAVIACEKKGWQLAVLDDPRVVYDFVVEFIGDVTFWVGGYRTEDSDIWKWVNGTIFNDNFPWADGEPNDAGGDEDCLALYPPHGYNDLPCYQPHYFICEIDKE